MFALKKNTIQHSKLSWLFFSFTVMNVVVVAIGMAIKVMVILPMAEMIRNNVVFVLYFGYISYNPSVTLLMTTHRSILICSFDLTLFLVSPPALSVWCVSLRIRSYIFPFSSFLLEVKVCGSVKISGHIICGTVPTSKNYPYSMIDTLIPHITKVHFMQIQSSAKK